MLPVFYKVYRIFIDFSIYFIFEILLFLPELNQASSICVSRSTMRRMSRRISRWSSFLSLRVTCNFPRSRSCVSRCRRRASARSICTWRSSSVRGRRDSCQRAISVAIGLSMIPPATDPPAPRQLPYQTPPTFLLSRYRAAAASRACRS